MTPSFLKFIRNLRSINESQDQLEAELVNIWNGYYAREIQTSEILDNHVELLKRAAISVKYYLERQFNPHELDYDISCACVLYEPFELHVDITPKHKRCLATIASIYLH